MKRRLPAQRAGAILAVPLALAGLTVAGLALGLTGDGWRNFLACLLAGLPLVVLARAWARAIRATRSNPSQTVSGKPEL